MERIACGRRSELPCMGHHAWVEAGRRRGSFAVLGTSVGTAVADFAPSWIA